MVYSFLVMCERKERKKNKIEIFMFGLLTVRRINGPLGIFYMYFRIPKHYAFLNLGAAPIPYVLDAILNLPNSFLRSTTMLLDYRLWVIW